MKIKIEKEKLKKILDKIQGLTNQKTSLKVTKNVLIKTLPDNKISFSATDLSAEYFCISDAFIEEQGEIGINAKKFYEIIKSFPENIINIEESESQWIKIGNNDIVFNLVGIETQDFPHVTNTFDYNFCETDGNMFKKLLSVGNSIHPEANESRSFVLGINIGFYNEENKAAIKMFSTDTRRISKYEVKSDSSFIDDFNEKSVVVPKKILPDLIKFIDHDSIEISFTDDLLIIKQEDEYFSVNLLEGAFPDCNGLVQSDEEYAIELEKYLFSDILSRISIVSNEKNPIIFLTLSENLLTFTASNPELGEAKENTDIEFSREGFEIAFNPRFIIDILKDVEDEKIKLYLKNSTTHCIIKGCEKDDYVAAVMPIKF